MKTIIRSVLCVSLLFCFVASKSQCNCTGGTNLVVNGDFSAGNTGFTSQYGYVSGCDYTGDSCTFTSCCGCNYTSVNASSYGIGNISGAFYTDWGNYLDHTCNCCSGSYMVINGACTTCPNQDVWCETMSVSTNTYYVFSFWGMVITAPPAASLQIVVNGTNLGSADNMSSQAHGTWIQYCQTWYSGSDTSADVCIIDETLSNGSNDFGLDDIAFQATCTSTATISSTNATCFGSNNGNIKVTVSGCSSPYTYMWTPSGGTNATDTALSAGTYTVVVTNANACALLDTTITITQPAPIVASITGDSLICLGSATTITASGGNAYIWSNGANSSSITVKPDSTTTYSVTVTNSSDCKTDTSFQVKVVSPDDSVIGPSYLCQGDTITLTAKGGATYKWSNGETNSSIVVYPTVNTTYNVIISNFCTDTVTKSISVDNPAFNVCCDTTIYAAGISVTLQASGTTKYYWTPDSDISCTSCPNPVVTPTVTTTYTLMGTDSLGCSVIRTITVDVDNCLKISVPNVFTPNGDGINDEFVVNARYTSAYSITIYDCWGNEIYQSGNPGVYWNGKNQSNNSYVSSGVYYYIIKYTCTDKPFTKDGYVQVIR